VSQPTSLEGLLRDTAPRVLGVLLRRFGDFSAAEDAVQEALLAAASQWPAQGTPENPLGWLIHVASRRMTDRLRSESSRREREHAAAAAAARDEVSAPPPVGDRDDTLELMFMCCHPALSDASAIALTLRAVAGLTTAEIASAFIVPEATMAQRISRAKRSIESSAVPFAMPRAREWGPRLRAVLRVLYLVFNEGYLTSGGSKLARVELSAEAIRLARILRATLPEDPEVAGLLALMLLSEARRAARTDAHGELAALDAQDRTRWDRRAIEEGQALLVEALGRGAVGEYQAQAAIAAAHDRAARVEDTDWREIAGWYRLLERIAGGPLVALNRAVAVGMADGPAAGLALLAALEQPLAGHHRLYAVRGHLLEMAGEQQAAIEDYRAAASRTASLPEQRYLLDRAARLAQA
jgi:RNA polymerase sigma factor (sigma-70 family)